MQNEIATISETETPVPGLPETPDNETCLIACPIFKRELESVLQQLGLYPTIKYMHYTIHNNPLMMEEQLVEKISDAQNAAQQVRLLVGKYCKGKRDMDEVVSDCNGKIPQARNCIDMLIGSELTKELQTNRTSLMTPAWIRMINTSIAEGQWSVTDARVNLGWYNKILLLDTGVEPLDDEMIMEFYDLIQVEIDILPVDLEHFKATLIELLQ